MGRFFTQEFITYAEVHNKNSQFIQKALNQKAEQKAQANMTTAGLYAEAALIKGFNAGGFRYGHLNASQQNAAYAFNKEDANIQVGAAARKAANAIDNMAITKIDQIKEQIHNVGHEMLGQNKRLDVSWGKTKSIKAGSSAGDLGLSTNLGTVALEIKLKSADIDLVNWSNIVEKKFFGANKPFTKYVSQTCGEEYWNHSLPKQQWMQSLGGALYDFVTTNYSDKQFFNYMRQKAVSADLNDLKDYAGKVVVGLQATNLSNQKGSDIKIHIESDVDMWNRLFKANAGAQKGGTQISYKQNQTEYGIQWLDSSDNLVASFVLSKFLNTKQYMAQKNAATDKNNFDIEVTDKKYLDFTFSTYINSKYFFNDSFL